MLRMVNLGASGENTYRDQSPPIYQADTHPTANNTIDAVEAGALPVNVTTPDDGWTNVRNVFSNMFQPAPRIAQQYAAGTAAGGGDRLSWFQRNQTPIIIAGLLAAAGGAYLVLR